MAGSAIIAKTAQSTLDRDPGFNAGSVITAQLDLPPTRYPSPPSSVAFYRALLSRMSNLPSVANIAISESLPLIGDPESTVFQLGQKTTNRPADMPTANYTVISPDYFRALGTALLKGRLLSDSDSLDTLPVAIINTTLAKRYSRDGDVIGKEIFIPGAALKMTIVGQVADINERSLVEKPVPEMFVPFTQRIWTPLTSMQVVIKYQGSAGPAVSQLRRAVRDLDPQIPISNVETLKAVKEQSIEQIQLMLRIVSVFSCASVLIAGAGLGTVLLEDIRRRRREFAIRTALGSPRRRIVALALQRASLIVPSGLGLLGSYASFKIVDHFIPGTVGLGYDWIMMLIVATLAVALTASIWPCLLAIRGDPANTLREG